MAAAGAAKPQELVQPGISQFDEDVVQGAVGVCGHQHRCTRCHQGTDGMHNGARLASAYTRTQVAANSVS